MKSKLAPGFLVASPTLRDPSFHRAVVLLVDHREDGSLGFVINKLAPVQFEDVIEELGIDPDAELKSPDVLLGGPVAPYTGWILFDPRTGNVDLERAVVVAPDIAVSASRDLLESIARGRGPSPRMMLLGYAGWGASQLDEEMREGSWIPADLDAAVIFSTPIEERWAKALASLGIDPGRMTTQIVADA